MAESVDALVSNTSRFTPVPVRPRLWVRKRRMIENLLRFVLAVSDVLPTQTQKDRPNGGLNCIVRICNGGTSFDSGALSRHST